MAEAFHQTNYVHVATKIDNLISNANDNIEGSAVFVREKCSEDNERETDNKTENYLCQINKITQHDLLETTTQMESRTHCSKRENNARKCEDVYGNTVNSKAALNSQQNSEVKHVETDNVLEVKVDIVPNSLNNEELRTPTSEIIDVCETVDDKNKEHDSKQREIKTNHFLKHHKNEEYVSSKSDGYLIHTIPSRTDSSKGDVTVVDFQNHEVTRTIGSNENASLETFMKMPPIESSAAESSDRVENMKNLSEIKSETEISEAEADHTIDTGTNVHVDNHSITEVTKTRDKIAENISSGETLVAVGNSKLTNAEETVTSAIQCITDIACEPDNQLSHCDPTEDDAASRSLARTVSDRAESINEADPSAAITPISEICQNEYGRRLENDPRHPGEENLADLHRDCSGNETNASATRSLARTVSDRAESIIDADQSAAITPSSEICQNEYGRRLENDPHHPGEENLTDLHWDCRGNETNASAARSLARTVSDRAENISDADRSAAITPISEICQNKYGRTLENYPCHPGEENSTALHRDCSGNETNASAASSLARTVSDRAENIIDADQCAAITPSSETCQNEYGRRLENDHSHPGEENLTDLHWNCSGNEANANRDCDNSLREKISKIVDYLENMDATSFMNPTESHYTPNLQMKKTNANIASDSNQRGKIILFSQLIKCLNARNGVSK